MKCCVCGKTNLSWRDTRYASMCSKGNNLATKFPRRSSSLELITWPLAYEFLDSLRWRKSATQTKNGADHIVSAPSSQGRENQMSASPKQFAPAHTDSNQTSQ